jgi:predicted nucleic-acid-binding Zn-ribbon protein
MKCPCCDSNVNFSSSAVMAPFISLITNQERKITAINYCLNCGFAFFTHRYNDLEMKLIYGKYRSAYYQQLRQTVEPNYSTIINNGLGGDDVSAQRQNLILENINICGIKPKSILDYGGDRGQMIPSELINENSYVYDLSDEKLVEGVQRIELQEIKSKSIDLVMINHTLEHMPEFSNNISILINDLKDGAYIYRIAI